jgi:hypothetical protein
VPVNRANQLKPIRLNLCSQGELPKNVYLDPKKPLERWEDQTPRIKQEVRKIDQLFEQSFEALNQRQVDGFLVRQNSLQNIITQFDKDEIVN